MMLTLVTILSLGLGPAAPAEPSEPIAVDAPSAAEPTSDAPDSADTSDPGAAESADAASAPTADSAPTSEPAALKPPSDAPPNPGARPSEGVHAVGSSGVAPLPPAPPPVSPSAIPAGSWRGQVWIGAILLGSGGIAGTTPARPSIISVGAGAEGGWRARQWIGIGTSVTHWPHEVIRRDVPGESSTILERGHGTAWDLAFVRLFAPVRGRFDPYLDVGGGLLIYDPARDRPTQAGATIRAGLGFDVWIARSLTFGLMGLYRANFVDGSVGHGWQAGLTFGIHW